MFTAEQIEEEPPKCVGAFTGRQIRDARSEKGWTQKQLAQACNIKLAIVRQYEQGETVMEPAIIAKLKRALGIQRLRKKPKSAIRERQRKDDASMRAYARLTYDGPANECAMRSFDYDYDY